MKRILLPLASLFILSFTLSGQNCALSIGVTISDCNPDGTVTLGITISDPSDNARDVAVSVDDVLLPGSPFRVRDDEPVFLTTEVPGDGLGHLINVVSEDEENCSAQTTVNVPDCGSDCFLSGLQLNFDGGTTHSVVVGNGGNNTFTPSQITITVGDIVSFDFVDDGHTTTSDATTGTDSWNSGFRGTGTSFPVTIINPGLHRYYCVPHGSPGGSGMAGSIVANCPGGSGFGLTAAFSTTQAGAAGYNLVIDGQVHAGSPYTYSGTGPQSVAFSLPGDGALHTVEIIDLTDGTCTLSRDITAPDCGQAPTCSLFLSAEETGFCRPDYQVNVALSVMAVNAGNSGFNVLLDGNLVAGSPFAYVSGGNTNLDILVPGDGQNHSITVTDADDATCSATSSLTTTNCTIPCELTNLTATTGVAGTIHIVDVEDFVFSPRDITIAAGDQVEWRWTGQIAHTATSDAETGPDSWDSGLLNTGATYQSPVLSAGLHNYYCIPHGTPGGNGMAGTITVLPDCTNGQVAVGITFNSTGTGAGYNVFVDGSAITGGPFSYDASGTTSTSVFVAGDGQSHSIEIRDSDDATCSVSTTVTTVDCNASTCQLTASIEETTGCDANLNVGATLTVNDVGGSANGFSLTVDGQPAGTFAYSGNGTTTVPLTLAGDGQSHEVIVTDADDTACTATASITTTNCTIPCELTNLTATTGSEGTIHIVDAEDFVFSPRDITIAAGDRVEWRWTGEIAHTATSSVDTGPDSWDS
ncbi:cupredoxin domain-containing protein, partial [Neolewinella agarilytica]